VLGSDLVIDAHCHVGKGMRYQLEPEALLAQMDAVGVDRAVLVPADRFIAVDNEAGNDYVLRTVDRWPGRFWGWAAVNPWYGERAVAELRRTVAAGLVGVKFDSALQGFMICDSVVLPVVEAAVELRVPMYFSTGTPVNALPLQVAELAQKYPQGQFIMGHMGNTDFWLDVTTALGLATNLWGEISYNLAAPVNGAVRAGFAGRLLFGSDVPMADLRLETGKVRYWQMSAEDRAAILSGNLLRLLGKA
jgi:uncharacterized protein